MRTQAHQDQLPSVYSMPRAMPFSHQPVWSSEYHSIYLRKDESQKNKNIIDNIL